LRKAYIFAKTGDKTIFAPHQQKLQFEMKNRRKSAEKAKALHLLFVTCLFFEVIKQI